MSIELINLCYVAAAALFIFGALLVGYIMGENREAAGQVCGVCMCCLCVAVIPALSLALTGVGQ